MNSRYFIIVFITVVIIPTAGFFIEHLTHDIPMSFVLFGKWFIFSAVGLRLFMAGIQQSAKPQFTAREIFHIEGSESLPIVRELGFANLCFGLVGIISLFQPEWRMVSAIASGLYFGLAGLLHTTKKTATANERFALWTDWIIFAVLLIYIVVTA